MRAQCLDESKAPMINMRKQECKEWLDDYNECLHHAKLVSVVRQVHGRSMGSSADAHVQPPRLSSQRTREYVVERERQRQEEGPKVAAAHGH